MPIILDGTAGITTPEIVSTGGPLVVNASAPDNSVVVNASGNVGIGTGSPVGKLNVIGGLGLGAALIGDQAVTPPSGSLVLSGSNQSSEQTYTSPGGATTLGQVYNYASSGNSFFRYLDIVAYGSTTGAGSNIRFITGNGTTNTERVRINTSGDLLIGLTTGSDAQIISQTNGDKYNMYYRSPTMYAGSHRFIRFQAGSPLATVGEISSNGTTTTYSTSSDYRLKHDLAPMTGALAKVQQLKPCTYKWNVDDSNGEGFIAHELQAVVPECVVGEKDAVDAEGNPQYQGIDTSFLVATLTAAIQELKAINDAQAQTIESLTARVVALENQIV